ncbi:hypothetical protein ACRFI0_24880 [Citrobacter freundii]|uniref:hypothetical protein n=2 Tax=Citrobacter freundii complex TaxID=1344959 RepID=UPI003D6CDC23
MEDSDGEFVRYEDHTLLEQKLTDMAVQLANAESKCRELAAENAGLKSTCDDRRTFIMNGVQLGYIQVPTVETDPALETIRTAVSPQAPTQATDTFLAEVRASTRNEGINYAASRLAAAFNHGFVDKPLAEVCDVVRMILDTKEELANSTLPAADGISGEYAEKFLAEFAAQPRKGAAL